MGVRGIQQQYVSRNDFITGQTDKISDSHIFPALVNIHFLLAMGQYEETQKTQKVKMMSRISVSTELKSKDHRMR